MARNCEKHFVRLNRMHLEEHWKNEKSKKRPFLNTLNSASEVKKWIPSIKREMDYCLQQLSGVRKHDYSADKIKEFQERLAGLEKEHRRFIHKVQRLDPDSVGIIPWENRAYASKRKAKKSKESSQQGTSSEDVKKKRFIATPILASEIESNEKEGTSEDENPENG